jgi:hypothetical protein
MRVAIGVSGGILGLAMAYGALRLMATKGPAIVPRIDPLALAFTLAISLSCGLLLGLNPC